MRSRLVRVAWGLPELLRGSGLVGIVLSHPFRIEREKDGAPSCSSQLDGGDGDGVFGEDVERGGGAEEDALAFNAFFVEGVVNVGGEVGTDGLLGEGEFGGPLGDEGVHVLEAVVAGLDEVGGDLTE